jgi:hypothetical protein
MAGSWAPAAAAGATSAVGRPGSSRARRQPRSAQRGSAAMRSSRGARRTAMRRASSSEVEPSGAAALLREGASDDSRYSRGPGPSLGPYSTFHGRWRSGGRASGGSCSSGAMQVQGQGQWQGQGQARSRGRARQRSAHLVLGPVAAHDRRAAVHLHQHTSLPVLPPPILPLHPHRGLALRAGLLEQRRRRRGRRLLPGVCGCMPAARGCRLRPAGCSSSRAGTWPRLVRLLPLLPLLLL